MKVGRVIGCVIAVILFITGMGIYSIHVSLKNVVSEQLIGATIDELVNTAVTSGTDILMKDVPDDIKNKITDGIIGVLPKEVENEIEKVKEDIASDPQIRALTEKYIDVLLAGSSDENVNMPDVNKDIEEIIETNIPKIAEAAGSNLSSEEISMLAKEVTSRVDVQEVLNKGVEMIRSTITPQQQQVLEIVSFVQSSQSLIMSIAFMVIAIVIAGLLKKSLYKWMPLIGGTSLIGGLVMLLTTALIKMFVEKAVTGFPSIVLTTTEGAIDSIVQSGQYFTVFGVLTVVVYMFIKFITNRVAYE